MTFDLTSLHRKVLTTLPNNHVRGRYIIDSTKPYRDWKWSLNLSVTLSLFQAGNVCHGWVTEKNLFLVKDKVPVCTVWLENLLKVSATIVGRN